MGRNLLMSITAAACLGITSVLGLSAQPVATTCADLLQHPLAWWLSSAPTSKERDVLTACMAGAGPLATTKASPSDDTPSVAALRRPSVWNTLSASDQALWTALAPKTWAQMTEQERRDWVRILTPPVRQTNPTGTRSALASSAGSAKSWTPAECQSELQMLSLLSQQIDRSLMQIQSGTPSKPSGQGSTAPPTYRCSDAGASDVTCAPQPSYVNPGTAATNAINEFMARRDAEAALDAAVRAVRSQQQDFTTRSNQWSAHCAAANRD